MKNRQLLAIAFCAGTVPHALCGQVPDASLLQIEVENHRFYKFDVDPSQYAKNTANLSKSFVGTASPFQSSIAIGDIVSVNGNQVKGTVFERIMGVATSPTPAAGQAIADVTHGDMIEWNLDILNLDGTPLGRILVQGLNQGPPPPGAPASIARASFMVLGGTGVFLGVRGGYLSNAPDPSTPIPGTSVAEDPSLRRVFGGGKTHITLYLIPQSAPQIVTSSSGPAVVHSSDFTAVSSSKPAAPGEVLSLFATGLGPTRPSVDPGKTFPADGSAKVVAPVAVMVNGTPAEVLGAVGYPGATDGYQVNFRVPSGVGSGVASLQLSAAWINGPELKIPIQ